ncbi:High-affinity zinc uptake system ATP-binding protein ZnuC [Pontiella desulfatans]|uniref:High-affinity zinc uptake system ATP-binding protein ZnuC n=1 Tax=Pontiella desulfatans TaxID=2750659 RepID=A0A6C2UDH8_PONDE|nr:ATP-binding cassette domain-containing protein [Pontiella desulfatans]VGO17607.1 High-affinity zinc uptake system ATP-binding protein ZnuC [Pontiella desulfatans]
MGGSIIVCKDVCVAYGRQEVLHNVNLEIPRGAFLPFIGCNGSGKTTLLRAILGLVPLRRGLIETPFDRAPAGYVPQHKVIDPLYPVSVRQIVEMGLYPRRRRFRRLDEEQRNASAAALEQLGLAEHAKKNFRELSGGMKQKTLIARALVSGSEVIVMDEPTSELDEQSENEVLSHLVELNAQRGITVLMVHHNRELVERFTHTMCRIQRGNAEIVSTGKGGGDNA